MALCEVSDWYRLRASERERERERETGGLQVWASPLATPEVTHTGVSMALKVWSRLTRRRRGCCHRKEGTCARVCVWSGASASRSRASVTARLVKRSDAFIPPVFNHRSALWIQFRPAVSAQKNFSATSSLRFLHPAFQLPDSPSRTPPNPPPVPPSTLCSRFSAPNPFSIKINSRRLIYELFVFCV